MPRFNLAENMPTMTITKQTGSPISVETWPKTAQERAGVMTQYPGISETRERYRPHPRPISEVLDNHGRLRPCQPGYQVNPNVEIRLPGWNKRTETESKVGDHSEYVSSFVWPDGNLIHPAPWNRSKLLN
ncbi:hypothetical protein FGIG_06599 [Fasciola gigantica]|uniref:Uncharacterized protein n=1 Tax=Fasciola gigantica TaxID=46835 RepID=A0A504Z4S0_FASGI|nr:hypothetical protein FGIG_06599 [Fasciola gigantica]